MSELISVDAAIGRLAAHALSTDAQRVPIQEAFGRRLAAPVIAKVSRPPAAVSAMDGYAVRLENVRREGAELTVVGEAPAGQPFAGTVGDREAVRIFTGAVLPEGADHIVIQEDTCRSDGIVHCRFAYDAPAFVRDAGMDFQAGETVLEAGTTLAAAEMSLVAAANLADVEVFRRPRVGLLANGNELRAPGETLGPGEIVNSNPIALSALIERWGGEPVDLGVAEDSVESIAEHIGRAHDIDLFVPIGGASVGDHDHMRGAFKEDGFETVFEKIAVKPGKPTWFSIRGNQRVLGLPGNPASALVCAHLFVKPLVAGAFALDLKRAVAGCEIEVNGQRESFLRGLVTIAEDGRLIATAADNQDSSLLRPFTRTNALIRREAGADPVRQGGVVDVMLLRGL